MYKYKYAISLGSHCHVATRLKSENKRFFSSPFAWLITSNIKFLIEYIKNNFDGFLDIENLIEQPETWTEKNVVKDNRLIKNVKGMLSFVHDFKKSDTVDNQIEDVKNKYIRRIDRFYKAICEPTLFIRYIYRENEEEIAYINSFYELIEKTFKDFNENSHVIYLANTEVEGKITAPIDIYYIPRDDSYEHSHYPLLQTSPAHCILDDVSDSLSFTDYTNLNLLNIDINLESKDSFDD